MRTVNEPERFSEDWWADVLVDNPLKLAGLLLIATFDRRGKSRVM